MHGIELGQPMPFDTQMLVMVTHTVKKKWARGQNQTNTTLKPLSLWAGCKNHIILIEK